jgi:hypothetical protein
MFLALDQSDWEIIYRTASVGNEHGAERKLVIENAIVSFLRQRSTSDVVKRKVDQVISGVSKIMGLLEALVQHDEFFYAETTGQVDQPDLASIADCAESLTKLEDEMKRVRARFGRAHSRLIVPEDGALSDFIFDLLMIQAGWREREPPTSSAESAANPRFREYVEKCVQAADRSISADKIAAALEAATRSYKKVKYADPVGWARNWKTPI